MIANIPQNVLDVSSKFKYTSDPKSSLNFIDFWFVMDEKLDGKLHGDCEDFSLTVMYRNLGCSFWKLFLALVITGKYKMYYSISKNGVAHCVGFAEGFWFDNWTMKAVSSKEEFIKLTGHDIKEPFWRVEMIRFLIVGYVYKKFGWH